MSQDEFCELWSKPPYESRGVIGRASSSTLRRWMKLGSSHSQPPQLLLEMAGSIGLLLLCG